MVDRESTIPPLRKPRITTTLERIVQLYESWHKPDEVDRWRDVLKARQSTEVSLRLLP
jgi:hypothetical protein